MTKQFVRWWLSFTIIFITIGSMLIAGLGKFIYESDSTYLSWLILLVFMFGSIHLGNNARLWHLKPKHDLLIYLIDTCTSLGLLGTIIGLIIMIVGGFSDLDMTNHSSIKNALIAISSGIGTALVTTLVGLISAMLLKFQLVLVAGGEDV